MRGGTANCTVVVSDQPIGSPVSQYPSIAVVFNNPSLEKYEDAVKSGGLLVVNESLVTFQPQRTDITVLSLPATALASELGDVRLTNMILFGGMLAHRPIVAMETAQNVLLDKLGARKAHLHGPNIAALERGRELALAQPAGMG
jgi:2-oxoglutarate ferredoxin oxidoreductase subunit gamma